MKLRGILCLFALGALLRCTSSSTQKTTVQDAGIPDAGPDAPAATCSDGIQNGNEIAVDCGGGCLCDTGEPCEKDGDCKDSACVAGKCQPPNCTDSLRNGLESDVDCGGTACPKCADLKACTSPDDCTSAVCTQAICQIPTCSDGAKNSTETGTDCGGGSCPTCPDGQGCNDSSDCLSTVCQGNKCVPASCADKVKNGNETDVDCGGLCGGCATNQACLGAADCLSGVCTANVCAAPACPDGVKNGTETDVDCGGSGCPKCADTLTCGQDADCQSDVCLSSVCQAPTCSDSKKNGAEGDVDCGGALCASCANGKSCNTPEDCASGGCTSTVCGPWSKSFGASGEDLGRAVAVAPNGDVVITGTFNGTVSFGGSTPLVASGANPDCFVARYTRTGTYVWARAFNGPGIDAAKAIAIGPSGDVFVTGSSGNADFGGGTLTTAGPGTDVFVVRLKGSDGTHMWSKLYGGSLNEEGNGIAVDSSGNVYVGGSSSSVSYDFGGSTFTGQGFADAFVMKISGTDGSHIWSHALGTSGSDVVYSVAVDTAGNPILAGRFAGGVAGPSTAPDFGTGTLSSVGYGDVMIVKFTSGGSQVWAKTAGSINDDYGWGLVTDSSNAIYVTGQRSGPMDFGAGAVPSFGSVDVFVAKLASDSTLAWSQGFGGSSIDAGYSVAIEGQNVLVMGAYLSTNLDFGFGALPSATSGKYSTFLARLDGTSGAPAAAAGYSGSDDVSGFVTYSPIVKTVLAVGRFSGAVDVGAGPLTAVAGNDIFLASLGGAP